MYLPLAILSTENLRHNVAVIRRQIRNNVQIMVMVKANAYGHGIRSTSLRLDGLVDYLGVARIDEAIALRKCGVKTKICIMQGVYDQGSVVTAACNNFDLVVHNLEQIHCLDVPLPRKVNVWLKVDTGIGRIGFQPSEALCVYQKLQSCAGVGDIILTSHLACSEDRDNAMNSRQMKIFAEIASDFPGKKSIANSGAIFNFPESHYDIVRPGISIYGISPIDNKSSENLDLKPVMTLMSKVMSVRDMPSGSTFGYGARFTSTKAMRVATIAMGYGDGYPRTAVDGTPILIKNKMCPIIGRVSMDMITVDVSGVHNIQSGDLVTLWGIGLPIEKVAKFTHNIAYDMLSAVQLRVIFNWA